MLGDIAKLFNVSAGTIRLTISENICLLFGHSLRFFEYIGNVISLKDHDIKISMDGKGRAMDKDIDDIRGAIRVSKSLEKRFLISPSRAMSCP